MIKSNSKYAMRAGGFVWLLFFTGMFHFFYGWIIIDHGWKIVNELSLIFFLIAGVLFLFLLFYYFNFGFLFLKSGSKEFQKQKVLFLGMSPIKRHLLEFLIFTDLFMVLIGILLSARSMK